MNTDTAAETIQKPTFMGLCVGGPLAGQFREEKGNYFRAFVVDDIAEPLAELRPIETGTYSIHTFRIGPRAFSFWLFAGLSLGDAFVEILQGYADSKRGKG